MSFILVCAGLNPGVYHFEPLCHRREVRAVSPINPAVDFCGEHLAAAQQAWVDSAIAWGRFAKRDGVPDVVLVIVNPSGAKPLFADLAHAVEQVEMGVGEVGKFLKALVVGQGFAIQISVMTV